MENVQGLPGKSGRRAWLKNRVELLVPCLAMVFFLLMSGDSPNAGPLVGLVFALSVAHVVWIVRNPEALRLPEKTPVAITKLDIWRTIIAVTIVVGVGATISILTARLFGLPNESESGSRSGVYLGMLLLIIVTASAGFIAEKTLPVDLIPIMRQRRLSRAGYILSSVLPIALVVMTVGGLLASNVASGVASLFGEASPSYDAVEAQPWALEFIEMLIGAGLFEELLFRAGLMTLVWKVTGKWGWGLVISSVLFGFYHITLSSISGNFIQTPIYSVVFSTILGFFLGYVYRMRGFMTVVLVHTLINFVSIMMFTT